MVSCALATTKYHEVYGENISWTNTTPRRIRMEIAAILRLLLTVVLDTKSSLWVPKHGMATDYASCIRSWLFGRVEDLNRKENSALPTPSSLSRSTPRVFFHENIVRWCTPVDCSRYSAGWNLTRDCIWLARVPHLRRSGVGIRARYPALTHWANLCRTYGAPKHCAVVYSDRLL
jgi:hypothetical protein